MSLRISFEEAINEERLLKPRFAELSFTQQTALKVAYGLPLSGDRCDERGFSELDYWSASQGEAEYDELGYLIRARPVPYVPRKWQEVWNIWGIRGGKTDTFSSTVVAYEATCGGHEAYIRPGRQAVVFLIAQDLRLARFSTHGVVSTLQSMDFIYAGGGPRNRITNVTADRVELWNGMTIMCIPPTVKSIRGYDAPVAVLDEVGVWYQDADSANPDYEIYRNVTSRQAQFPDAMTVGISSPWNKGGLLYKRYSTGTAGSKLACPKHGVAMGGSSEGAECRDCEAVRRPHRNYLVMHYPTAVLTSATNPHVSRHWLQTKLDEDPKAFAREALGVFQDSLSGFLASDMVTAAVDHGVKERTPAPFNYYVAAIDPAFRNDSFTFCIGHADERGVVVDLLREWVPKAGEPVSLDEVLPQIAALLKQYKVASVYGDQYQFEALNKLALEHGFNIELVNFTATKKASIYGNLQQLVNTRRIHLLDHTAATQELMQLERKMNRGGTVRIGAPEGLHDDLATVIALMASGAVWLTPSAAEPPKKPPTIFEQCQDTIRRKGSVRAWQSPV